MPVSDLTRALNDSVKDDALSRHFLAVWPVIESILEAFSKATNLPIFVYLNDALVFHSSMQTMPHFCEAMLNSEEMRPLCVADGRRRAAMLEPFVADAPGVQLCHAGMANGRRELNTSAGKFLILYGSRKATTPEALERRARAVAIAGAKNAELDGKLRAADDRDEPAHGAAGGTDRGGAPRSAPSLINPSDADLLNAISEIIKGLVSATVGFRSLTINMAHELSNMMVGAGLLLNELEYAVKEFKDSPESASIIEDLLDTQSLVMRESRLGLYIVRNFLSHASETRYREAVKSKFEQVDLAPILEDMLSLHRRQAALKDITFDTSGIGQLPIVHGTEFEIRRLFHNVINNAIKYSYHSVTHAHRTIRIKSKVPYDPVRMRFAVAVENFGLGITADEMRDVFKPGFRGKQAREEVPIGAGIGLSEAQKIMKVHKGFMKLRSKELYIDEAGRRTYLTTVEMVFPYKDETRLSLERGAHR